MSDVEISNALKNGQTVEKLKKLITMHLKENFLFDDNITLPEDIFKKCMIAVGIYIDTEVCILLLFYF